MIYIISPADTTTGGVECLHQLGNSFIKAGHECKIHYIGNSKKAEIFFKYYGVNAALEIEDLNKNILIVPEIMTNIMGNFRHIKKCIFWLSLDNYLYRKRENIFVDYYKRFRSLLGGRVPVFFMKKYFHITQSHYASEYLKRFGINSTLIGDYLNDDFINTAIHTKNTIVKSDQVIFNPAKGKKSLKLLKKLFPNYQYIPLVNMSKEEVIKSLNSAKVYVDLGQHPGKDRIPREASLMGCVVFTSRFGSAGNSFDVPLDSYFKVETSANSIADLGKKIQLVFDEYIKYSKMQDAYRDSILKEKLAFDRAVIELYSSISSHNF